MCASWFVSGPQTHSSGERTNACDYFGKMTGITLKQKRREKDVQVSWKKSEPIEQLQ